MQRGKGKTGMARTYRAMWMGSTIMAGALGIIGIALACAAQAPALPPPPPLVSPPVINNRATLFMQRQGNVTGGNSITTYVQRETRLIDKDDKRTYVLLAPGSRGYYGRRIMRQMDGTFRIQTERVPTPGEKAAVPAVSSAGLLVVLPPGDGDGLNAVEFWADVMQKVLKGRYYVALAVAPRWESSHLTTWLTDNNVKQVKDARFSTETMAADIARDVSAIHNIDPRRVFLHGAAESGLAAYACSLHDTTPFKGFYIHDAPFRSAQLPSLAHAHGRRYYLQQSQDDKNEPLWMADVARKLLTDQGASVKMVTYHGSGPYNFADDRWENMSEAMAWLEAGVPPVKIK